jgi:hypothetical protein
MNENAFSRKSSIKIKETLTGQLHDSVGFSKTDGYIMSQEEHLSTLERNGFLVERTPDGILITKISQ